MQEWLGKNNILMHSTHSEGKSSIAERYINILKAKIYKKSSDSKWYLLMLANLTISIPYQYNNI